MAAACTPLVFVYRLRAKGIEGDTPELCRTAPAWSSMGNCCKHESHPEPPLVLRRLRYVSKAALADMAICVDHAYRPKA